MDRLTEIENNWKKSLPSRERVESDIEWLIECLKGVILLKDEYAARLDESDAENERLRAQHEQDLADNIDIGTECKGLRVEIKRLREELAEWQSTHAVVVELRGLIESHMDTARGEWECVAEVERLANNAERAINILTPLFVKAQEADSTDEEALGGAMDVLAGYFGQNGRPLRKLDELVAEVERLKAELGSDESIDRAVWKSRAERAEAENDVWQKKLTEDAWPEIDRLRAALEASHPHVYAKPGCRACEVLALSKD